jgi:hypothetical protein
MATVIPTTPPVLSPAGTLPPPVPTPLSPDQFSNPTMEPIATTPTEAAFTESDRVTLRYVLNILKAARADVKSPDAKVAASGKRQVEAMASYLVGFCDGRGLTEEVRVKPGFQTVFGADAQPDLDTALNELETTLETALATVDTRGWRSWAHAIGDACIAVGAAMLF